MMRPNSRPELAPLRVAAAAAPAARPGDSVDWKGSLGLPEGPGSPPASGRCGLAMQRQCQWHCGTRRVFFMVLSESGGGLRLERRASLSHGEPGDPAAVLRRLVAGALLLRPPGTSAHSLSSYLELESAKCSVGVCTE
jgi:hypothetical protein